MYALFHQIILRPSLNSSICTDDDFAVSVLARLLKNSEDAQFFRQRSMITPFTIYNNETDFMEAKNADGSWAGADMGWTEGDKWAYSFDVVHAMDELIEARGGRAAFVNSLQAHFDGGKWAA